MNIKLQQLKDVVVRAKENEKFSIALKEEVTRVTNAAVLVEERDLGDICDEALDHLSTNQRFGRESGKIKTSVLLKMVEHTDSRVRRLAARMLPEGQLYRLVSDVNYAVRYEVANRVTITELKNMIRRHPSDDGLQTIYKNRIAEAKEDGMLWSSGKKLGAIAKQNEEPLLSDGWYQNLANIIYNDIGRSINNNPMYNMARQFAQHSKASFGVDINVDKLVDALTDVIEAHEDAVVDRSGLKEAVNHLNELSFLQETIIWTPADLDSVEDLLESRVSGNEYIERAEQIFSIQLEGPNRSQTKLLLREGIDTIDNVPVTGILQVETIRAIDEKALDRYVGFWNKQQILEGNTLRLGWYNCGNEIYFEVTA